MGQALSGDEGLSFYAFSQKKTFLIAFLHSFVYHTIKGKQQ